MNKRQSLSVVLATFNEEKNLPGCLDSLKDIADEIVIADGTSTDKTVEVARKYGAIVKITTNKPNFHINKQMAIDAASKDWILQMDADEHLSPELKSEIQQILNGGSSFLEDSQSSKEPSADYNGYWMPRKNWFLGRFLMKGGQYPDYTLRFYKKGKGRLPQKDVHEQTEVDGKVGYLKSALLHYPYANFKHYLRKWNFYNNFFANQIKEEQENKNIIQKLFYAVMYLFVRPLHWLFTTFIRHKGFVDGWQGFTFSLFSALRFPAGYIKYIGPYKFFITIIIMAAAVIRLWNFPTRWGLGGDDGRDAMIALEALRLHQLPLMGPFSSAGPFVIGPIYFWFIMFSYLILPFFVNAPWILMEIISIASVGILIYLGKLLKGNRFSIIVGILAVFSPQLVVKGVALSNVTFIYTFCSLLLICYLLLWQKKNKILAFLMGIFVGLAIGFHYQSLNLLIFFPAIFLIPTLKIKDKLISFALMIVGFILPSLPILYWDAHQNFANIRNILDYFLIGEYRIYVANSWKLFIFKYIPGYWSFVVGNFQLIGLSIFISSFIAFVYAVVKKKISLNFVVLGGIFSLFLIVNRFYKGERSEGYLLYFLPFIIIFSALLIEVLWEFKNKFIKTIAVFILFGVIFCNMFSVFGLLTYQSPAKNVEIVKNYLYNKFPDTKFSVYDYKYKQYNSSMALSLLLAFDKREDINGKKIGLNCESLDCPEKLPSIYKKGPIIVDLNSVNENQLYGSKPTWVNVNQVSVYDDLIGWLNKNQLKSNFSLQDYFTNKIKNI